MRSRLRLLLVDDTPGSAALRSLLERNGFAVDIATNGDEALSLAGKARPDAVVMEFALRGMQAAELCSSLRKLNAAAPILVLTALSSTAVKMEAFSAGADDVLLKPASPDDILGHLRPLRNERLAVNSKTLRFLPIAKFFRIAAQAGDAPRHVRLKLGASSGRLVLEGASVVFAKYNEQNGKAALEAMLRHPMPGIEFAEPTPFQPNMSIPLHDAIEQWLAKVEPWRIAWLVLPAKDTLVRLKTSNADFPGTGLLPAGKAVSLSELLVTSDADRIKKVAALWLLGELIEANEPTLDVPEKTTGFESLQLSMTVDRLRTANLELSSTAVVELAEQKRLLVEQEEELARKELETRRLRATEKRLEDVTSTEQAAKADLAKKLQAVGVELDLSKQEGEKWRKQLWEAQKLDGRKTKEKFGNIADLQLRISTARQEAERAQSKTVALGNQLNDALSFKARLPAGVVGVLVGIGLSTLVGYGAFSTSQVGSTQAALKASPPVQAAVNVPVESNVQGNGQEAAAVAKPTIVAAVEPPVKAPARSEAPHSKPVQSRAPKQPAQPSKPAVKKAVAAAAPANPDAQRAKALFNRGKAAYGKMDFKAAVRLLDESARLAPNAATLIELGKAHYDLGAPNKAEAAYRKALTLSKSSGEAHLGLGMVLAERGEITPAKTELSAFLKLAPTHPLAGQVEMMLSQLP